MHEYSGNFCKRIPTDIDLPAVGGSSLIFFSPTSFLIALCASADFVSMILKTYFCITLCASWCKFTRMCPVVLNSFYSWSLEFWQTNLDFANADWLWQSYNGDIKAWWQTTRWSWMFFPGIILYTCVLYTCVLYNWWYSVLFKMMLFNVGLLSFFSVPFCILPYMEKEELGLPLYHSPVRTFSVIYFAQLIWILSLLVCWNKVGHCFQCWFYC